MFFDAPLLLPPLMSTATQAMIDQEARDNIARVAAMIERHQAVCDANEKRRSAVEAERDKRLDQFMTTLRSDVARGLRDLEDRVVAIQAAYDASYRDVTSRVAAVDTKIGDRVDKSEERQRITNRELYGRFWSLSIGGGGTVIAGLIAALWAIVSGKLVH